MRYFLILAMFFALAQARVSISTPNVFIDSHYYKKGYKLTTKTIIEVITSVAISQGIIIDHTTTALILDGKSFLKNSKEF